MFDELSAWRNNDEVEPTPEQNGAFLHKAVFGRVKLNDPEAVLDALFPFGDRGGDRG
jgi:hypothetical protein